MCAKRLMVVFISLFSLVCPACLGNVYPVPTVTKKLAPLGPDKSAIDMSEYATIDITVSGDTVYEQSGVETAVVIALDESGSMDDLCTHSRAAAKTVVNSLNPMDKVALVTFSTNAQKVVSLTTQHAQAIAAINNLPSPDGMTNVKAAFDLANTILLQDKTAIKKIVILFTDGMPTPLTQIDQLDDKKSFLNANNINYYTAGYGDFSKAWLKDLAEDTGGEFCAPTSPDDISVCFKTFWEEASQYVHAQQVIVNEVLSANFEVKPGSCTYSTGGGVKELKEFADGMEAAKSNFYSTGTLTTPPIYELPKGRTFNLSFAVKPKTCQPVLAKLPVNDEKKTYLAFKYGAGEFKVTPPQFNQEYIPVNPCGVYIDKNFEQINRVVTIEIRNTFQDRNVNDIHVVDILGEHVYGDAYVATPFTYGTLGQVVWPHYPPGSSWEPDGVEWRFFNGVPATQYQKYPPHDWSITSHGYIEPNTNLKLSLPIVAKASAEGKSPVTINKGRVLDPDVPQEGAQISFWYYFEHAADKIPSEQVGKYTYNYSYEDLPFGFSDQWGSKRHVVIYLPELEVLTLPPQWPIVGETSGPTYFVVDDFESYGISDSLVKKWTDGLTNRTGSSIEPGVAPNHPTHSGMQSIRFAYDNASSPHYSEIERTWDTPEDWTGYGIRALSLWIHGTSSNAVEPVYVGVQDSAGRAAVAYSDDNRTLLTEDGWMEWSLDLEVFAGGVDLASVQTMYVGIGESGASRPGGTGFVYVDDIRLCSESDAY